MEIDKFERIKNYQKNSTNLETLEREIQNHYQNIYTNPDIHLLKIFHQCLMEKDVFQGIEYRCLCWLNMIYDFPITLNKPFLTNPISLELEEFRKTYLKSEKRKQLFKLLYEFITEKKEQSNSDYLKVIIGGSFTDEYNDCPNDIDLAILTPTSIEEFDTNFNEIYLYLSDLIPKGLDLVFLPESLDKKSFKVFSRIIALGNNAKIKEKAEIKITSNTFEQRKIIELKI